MIDVLSIAAEVYPLVKTGGLADVVGALPRALAPFGVAMRTLVPGYPAVLAQLENKQTVADLPDYFGGAASLVAGSAGGLDVIVLDAPHLFDRPGNPYVGPDGKDWADNGLRFAALSFAAYAIGRGVIEGYQPQVLHAHDWQAGLVPAYVAFNAPSPVKTVMTVHNLAFQGVFGWDVFPALRLDHRAAREGAIEYFGNISYLKAGLQCADVLTTVSPTYACEIRTQSFGMGLEGVLKSRADVLHGILNGIDTQEWNPGHDAALPEGYGAGSTHLRAAGKAQLAQTFGLEAGEGPLFGVVSRLTWQKGMDLLAECIDDLVARGGRLAVLGSGEVALENGFKAAAIRHPGKVGIITRYDEKLSHLVQGGADVMVVPSRFEPCGLTQLYGLRYGTVPVVALTGGLADTVINASAAGLAAGAATGLQFHPVTAEALTHALNRLCDLYADRATFAAMQANGMAHPVGWDASARAYAALYEDVARP